VKVHDIAQRTPAWYAVRLGKLTASRAGDMMATIKTGEAAARRDLRMQLVCERLTGLSQEDAYVNAAMQRGIDKESDAFAAYEALTGRLANPVGFVAHDSLAAGCSPDGEVNGYQGVLELKCPKSATHLSYLRLRTVPKEYLHQIIHSIWITGAQWCDFVSFDDRFPAPLQVLCVRVPRDEAQIASYEIMVRAFLGEVEKEVEAVSQLIPVEAIA
jgi:hypothetical protein